MMELFEPNIEGLIKSFSDENQDVHQRAVDVLGRIGEPAVEPLITALGDKNVRLGAAEALGEIGDPAVEPLITALGDEDENVRSGAVDVLGEIGDPRAVEPLITALGDEAKFVRTCAAEALGKIGDVRAVEPLIAALGDGYMNMRAQAAYALGRIGDPRAVDSVIAALGGDDPWVRLSATLSLGEIGDPRAVEPLITALGDEDEYVCGEAAHALGKIGDPRTIPILEKVTNDSNVRVRDAAKEALAKIKSSDMHKNYLKETETLKVKKAYEETSDFISLTESEMAELKSSGAKLWSAEGLLKQAKAELGENNFEQATELVNKAKKVANKTKEEYDSAVELISETEEILSKIRSDGVRVSDELLKKPKQAFDDGDYSAAVRSAEELKSLAVGMKKSHKEALAFISSIAAEITELKSSGVKIPEAESLLEQANVELNENNVARVRELATKAKNVANERKTEYVLAGKAIPEVERIVSKARYEGVVVPDELLTKSKQAFDDGNYEEAYGSAEKLKSLIKSRETKCREASECIKSAEYVMEKVREFGCDPSSAFSLLEEANSTFDAGNYEESIKYTKQSEDTAKMIQEESKPEISLNLPEETFPPNTWKKIDVTIRNTGSMHAKEIEIEPSGDIEFRRISTIPQLNTNETETITIAMKPTVAGDVPVDIALTYKDALDRDYTSSEEVWVTVADPTSGQAPPRGTSSTIEIKRDYEVLSNNDLRFGIRVVNSTDYAIMDVKTGTVEFSSDGMKHSFQNLFNR